ncbi:UbiX family flavin prenyltransferase [Nocardia mexicana]|uniref:Flavin prenyltransferase UbiX n=1 Tax=Nocardia mexicana TaxID=279262 RepID=A0A370HGB4_9NOCA|nr:UbiX family flavin prenyltransferase [Nocardia mexicana]RDI56045.1 4-hydroxy-3-polyprenylbenzoate decarboxylase/2,5-furandicarboxylate decarboxylase 2 [Nocardia mexicana]
MTLDRSNGGPPPGRPRLIVGVTGASAPQLAVHLLTALRRSAVVETHLVISRAAHRTLELETGVRPDELAALADVCHQRGDIAASIASGSFLTMGMVVVPCSMKTLAAIAHGYSDDLLTRAADVCLKERRRLVLVARETPLSLVHLRNMTAVTEAGAVVLPPVPAFYQRPDSIADLLAHLSGKVLDQFGIAHDLSPRWEGPVTARTIGAAR